MKKGREKKKHAKFKIKSTKDQYMFQLTPLKYLFITVLLNLMIKI